VACVNLEPPDISVMQVSGRISSVPMPTGCAIAACLIGSLPSLGSAVRGGLPLRPWGTCCADNREEFLDIVGVLLVRGRWAPGLPPGKWEPTLLDLIACLLATFFARFFTYSGK